MDPRPQPSTDGQWSPAPGTLYGGAHQQSWSPSDPTWLGGSETAYGAPGQSIRGPQPPTYDMSAAPPSGYDGAPAFLPTHPATAAAGNADTQPQAPYRAAGVPGDPTSAMPAPDFTGSMPRPDYSGSVPAGDYSTGSGFATDVPGAEPPPPYTPGWDQSQNITEQIPDGSGWVAGRARGTATAGRAIVMTVGDLLCVVGGLFVLFCSVLPFVGYSDERLVKLVGQQNLPTSWTAWSPQTFLAPLSWVAILAALGAAVLTTLRVLGYKQPKLLGFDGGQLRLLLAIQSTLILFCLAVSQKTVLFGDDRPQVTTTGDRIDSTLSLSIGGYLMLLFAIATLVGAALTLRGPGGPTVFPLPEAARKLAERKPRAHRPIPMPTPDHPMPDHPMPGHPMPGQPVTGQPMSAQPMSGQPIPAQAVYGDPAQMPAGYPDPAPPVVPMPTGYPAQSAYPSSAPPTHGNYPPPQY